MYIPPAPTLTDCIDHTADRCCVQHPHKRLPPHNAANSNGGKPLQGNKPTTAPGSKRSGPPRHPRVNAAACIRKIGLSHQWHFRSGDGAVTEYPQHLCARFRRNDPLSNDDNMLSTNSTIRHQFGGNWLRPSTATPTAAFPARPAQDIQHLHHLAHLPTLCTKFLPEPPFSSGTDSPRGLAA